MDETIKPPKSPLLTSALKYWDFGGQGSTQRVLQGLNILSIYSSFRHRHLPQVHLGFAISNKLEVWTLSWQLLPPCKCCLGHRMVIQKLQGVASMANHSFWDSTLLPLKSMYSQVIRSYVHFCLRTDHRWEEKGEGAGAVSPARNSWDGQEFMAGCTSPTSEDGVYRIYPRVRGKFNRGSGDQSPMIFS